MRRVILLFMLLISTTLIFGKTVSTFDEFKADFEKFKEQGNGLLVYSYKYQYCDFILVINADHKDLDLNFFIPAENNFFEIDAEDFRFITESSYVCDNAEDAHRVFYFDTVEFKDNCLFISAYKNQVLFSKEYNNLLKLLAKVKNGEIKYLEANRNSNSKFSYTETVTKQVAKYDYYGRTNGYTTTQDVENKSRSVTGKKKKYICGQEFTHAAFVTVRDAIGENFVALKNDGGGVIIIPSPTKIEKTGLFINTKSFEKILDLYKEEDLKKYKRENRYTSSFSANATFIKISPDNGYFISKEELEELLPTVEIKK